MIRFRQISAFLVIAAAACGGGSKPAPAPSPAMSFTGAVAAANKRVETGDYAGADRILADFALKSKDSQLATEASFYRALYMIDPQNKSSSMEAGIRALNIYLSSSGEKAHKAEAMILKRTAQSVQSLRTVAAPPPKVVGRDTVYVTREDEIAQLKDQLAKANAEIERIKKRLANPSKLN